MTSKQNIIINKTTNNKHFDKHRRKDKPDELRGSVPIDVQFRPYTVTYPSRPTEWPQNMPVVILKTNSFQVKGKILETQVHQFEVTFRPSIKSELAHLRDKVVFGSGIEKKRTNYQLLHEQFGEFE